MLTGSGGASGRDACAEQHLDRADHLDVPAFDLQLQRHLKQPRRARIARVEAVAEAREGIAGFAPAIDDLRRRIPVRRALAHDLQPASRNGMQLSMSPP